MATEESRELFAHPDNAHRPICYFELPALQDETRNEKIKNEINVCLHSGFGTVIPQLQKETELTEEDVPALREVYAAVLSEAKKSGLNVGIYLDPALEHLVIRTLDAIADTGLRSMLLECKEYRCTAGEIAKHKLQTKGELLSLVAFSEETYEIIDLRSDVKEGELTFSVPTGNWVIKEYRAVKDKEKEAANYLSYDASYNYICAVFALFGEVLAPYLGNTLSLLAYSGIGFNGLNRRNFDPSFNTLFIKRFGFDPAVYYPALFGYIGPKTPHIKAMMMTVRASMIQHGIIQALHDFALRNGLTAFGNLTEPKATACSFLSGDAMLNNLYSPCALYDKAYLYGTNSVKIAAGAAYNYDVERVNCELFRNYKRHGREALLKDAMNAYARGVNCTALHLTPELCENSKFCDFTARVQTMLRGGRHIADIAVLYPIYFLHSKVNLFFDRNAKGFEYSETPSSADYMSIINSVSLYAGHDVTVLHPKVLNARCHTAGGILYLDNHNNCEQFRVVILPSANIISLANLRTLKKFFDEGGKLIATGELPTMAFEYDETGENDKEVCRLVAEIFGNEACNKMVMRDYCYNKSAGGGEAIFLYFNASATDGTKMIKGATINEALNSFGIPFDVYLPGMPRSENSGALNSIFPEFHTIGLHRGFPGGGMLGHIHKHRDGAEIYYFSNTSDLEYNHHVMLRGAFDVEEWNPYTGEIKPRNGKLLRYKGSLYTNLRLTLCSSESRFFTATPADLEGREITEITSIEKLRSYHAALMSEF